MEIKNKKAFFFTLTVIIILTLFLASFSLYDEINERESIQKRVETMNNFMSSVEKDLARKMYIGTYRATFIAENKIIDDKSFISNVDVFYDDALKKGIIENNSGEILYNYNLKGIIREVNQTSNLLGATFNLDYSNADIKVTQDDPWHIKTTLTVDMILVDESGLAILNRTKRQIVSYVPITNFEDPVYFIKTSGAVTNPITMTPYQFRLNDISNFSRHVNSSYYYANPLAPSFLQRLKGDLTTDPQGNGIESFVNLPKIQAQGVSIDSDKSTVDYIYFGSTDPAYYAVAGMPSWFKMDDPSRYTIYNITIP